MYTVFFGLLIVTNLSTSFSGVDCTVLVPVGNCCWVTKAQIRKAKYKLKKKNTPKQRCCRIVYCDCVVYYKHMYTCTECLPPRCLDPDPPLAECPRIHDHQSRCTRTLQASTLRAAAGGLFGNRWGWLLLVIMSAVSRFFFVFFYQILIIYIEISSIWPRILINNCIQTSNTCNYIHDPGFLT